MIIGFIFWSVLAVGLAAIGLVSWKSKKPVGFFAGIKPPAVTDTGKYNRAVGTIWIIYAVVFELCGVPLLFLKRNSAAFAFIMLGVVAASIGLAVAYTVIAAKYEKNE